MSRAPCPWGQGATATGAAAGIGLEKAWPQRANGCGAARSHSCGSFLSPTTFSMCTIYYPQYLVDGRRRIVIVCDSGPEPTGWCALQFRPAPPDPKLGGRGQALTRSGEEELRWAL